MALEIQAGIDPEDAVDDLFDQVGFDDMTAPQKIFYAVSWYRREVDNGGHRQYFYNSSSDIYPTAIDGLLTIGAPKRSRILSESTRAFVLLAPFTGQSLMPHSF